MDLKPDRLRFKFENFAAYFPAPEDIDSDEELFESHRIYSKDLTDCNGIEWRLSLFAHRDEELWVDDAVYIGLKLENRSELLLDFKFQVSRKNAKRYRDVFGTGFHLIVDDETTFNEFIKHSTIFDATNEILEDGALHINVFIQPRYSHDYTEYSHIQGHQRKMLDLLKKEEKTDVSVNVGGRNFHLHSLILDHNAPILADYCKQSHVVITDMESGAFEIILKHVYSGYLPTNYDVHYHVEDLIDAANRFELTELKDAVEHNFVCERHVYEWNAADCIVFADAQSCPLLKEYAISVFLLFAKDILKSDDSEDLRESGELMSQIMVKIVDYYEGDKQGKRKLEGDESKEATRQRTE